MFRQVFYALAYLQLVFSCHPGDRFGFIANPGCTNCESSQGNGIGKPTPAMSVEEIREFWVSILRNVFGLSEPCGDKEWGQWSDFSECSEPCAGIQKRNRKCLKPNGICQGRALDVQPCDEMGCHKITTNELQYVWGEWTQWSPCHLTCGHGVRTRERSCSSMNLCQGLSREEQPCMMEECQAVQGTWQPWSSYGPCTRSCGGGVRLRERDCVGSRHGGRCEGHEKEEDTCNERPCPVDGVLGEWSEFGPCSQSCGPEGLQTRTRECIPPQNGGRLCQENTREVRPCRNNLPCSVQGGWSDWSRMAQCSVSCGEGTQTYRRTCTNPPPSFRGETCQGPDRKQVPCQMEQCSVPFHLHVSNAVNNEGMAGAQVLYQIGDSLGEVRRGVTDANGDISLDGVQLGQKIILSIVREGFIPLKNSVMWANATYTGSSHVISMSQEFKFSDSKRVVLNWGPYPVDMDIRVAQLDRQRKRVICVVAYNHKHCENVAFDVDVLTGDQGAETITWHQSDDYDYALIVKDYSMKPEMPLIKSEAKVTLFGPGENVISLEVPKDEAQIVSRYWIVGCLSGA
ncbi:A disintegrin and metalloproteinase with thrombospondin motifs adt-2-like isoform X4 [Tigriopus californicus]|uniref:A disintegrin and metalloproteinase with thrombospondin motifs adt-2-like isoform X4 n=2 Tax=Tigriopus californicus TaxID=6832 RepID=UPI0027DA3FC5|nr:A disintegrin and metalloproteinase with thrombospondin motifs adt-2-like isoform X4 [Tigriopus californicus]